MELQCRISVNSYYVPRTLHYKRIRSNTLRYNKPISVIKSTQQVSEVMSEAAISFLFANGALSCTKLR